MKAGKWKAMYFTITNKYMQGTSLYPVFFVILQFCYILCAIFLFQPIYIYDRIYAVKICLIGEYFEKIIYIYIYHMPVRNCYGLFFSRWYFHIYSRRRKNANKL